MSGPNRDDGMSFEQAVLLLRTKPDVEKLLYDSFLDSDLEGGGRRFLASEEFEEVLAIAGRHVRGGVVVDIGAGTGIASFAFAKSGARQVYAVEPDPSDIVDAGATRRLTKGLPVEVVADWGESIGLPDAVADVVYCRQVLHHSRDLESFLAECARLMKPGALFIASREHVVTDQAQLDEFLAGHVIHELTHGEGAFELPRYLQAISATGLEVIQVYGPLDSVVNSYPGFSRGELAELPRKRWRQKLGTLGSAIAAVPAASKWMKRRVAREPESAPGRLYTFVAVKPLERNRG
jgi:ubiquinone/menaquinone biosynthesis C-methylase UbiE